MSEEHLRYVLLSHELDAAANFDLTSESGRLDFVDQFLTAPSESLSDQTRTAMQSVVLAQVMQDDPPETAATAARLSELGLAADEVRREITLIVTANLAEAIEHKAPIDVEKYVRDLANLPLPTTATVETFIIEKLIDEPGSSIELVRKQAATKLDDGNSVVASMVASVIGHLVFGPVGLLPPDKAVYIPDLIEGISLTHRLNHIEKELAIITASFDIAAFQAFDELLFESGEEIEPFSAAEEHLAWAGPARWLDEFAAGDLLSITVDWERPAQLSDEDPVVGIVRITTLDHEPAVPSEVLSGVRAGYDDLVDEVQLPVQGDQLTWWLLLNHPQLFAEPQQPLSELCTAAGLDFYAGKVAHDDSIWRNQQLIDASALVRDHGLGEDEQEVVRSMIRSFVDQNTPIEQLRADLAACAENELLDTLASILIPTWISPADEFERNRVDSPGHVFESVGRATAVAERPREIATAEYLAAILHERCAQPTIAEEHLRRANSASPGISLIVERLGWYAFDRSDAREARRWWHKLPYEHPAADLVQTSHNRPETTKKIGRNDPCWCGSGRKYKHCHQGESSLPALPDRVLWLARKASLWLTHATGDRRDLAVDCTIAFALRDPDPDAVYGVDPEELDDLVAAASEDPMIFDAVLHEGGMFAHFLAERGELLPEDEQLLLASWMTVDRSVHEIISVEPGVGFAAKDIATGEIIDVRERTASQQIQVGERYCARLLPDGQSNQIVGGVFPVRVGVENDVLALCEEGDPYEMCAWAGATLAPPTIEHRPGMLDAMIDRAQLDAALEALGESPDDETIRNVMGKELQRQFQAQWLTESIPALNGLTPREAAADPTRRGDLERLLQSFEQPRDAGLPGGMQPFTYDVQALRQELGLD